MGEFGVQKPLEPLDQPLVIEVVAELHLIRAVFQHIADDELQHIVDTLHVVLQIGEGHLRLDHPELGRVAGGVGVLGAEGRPEGVDVAESHRHRLRLHLAGDGEVGLPPEEVLAVVDFAVLGAGRVLGVDGRHPEHLARPFAVAGGDEGGVDVDKPALLEEGVDGVGNRRTDPEDRLEGVGPGAEVGDAPQELQRMPFFLERVVGGHRA